MMMMMMMMMTTMMMTMMRWVKMDGVITSANFMPRDISSLAAARDGLNDLSSGPWMDGQMDELEGWMDE